jgi:hypothetical protein
MAPESAKDQRGWSENRTRITNVRQVQVIENEPNPQPTHLGLRVQKSVDSIVDAILYVGLALDDGKPFRIGLAGEQNDRACAACASTCQRSPRWRFNVLY